MQDNTLITYERLYEILRQEKYKKELQKLEQEFIEKVTRYINEKKIILQGYETKDNIFANQSITKTKRQLETAMILLKELYERREGKITQLAMFNARTNNYLQDPDSLLKEEKQLYNDLISTFTQYKTGFLDNLIQGKRPKIEIKVKEQITSNKLIRFINNVPKFVGEDMKDYGPYNPEDISHIPEKIAEILIKNNVAESI